MPNSYSRRISSNSSALVLGSIPICCALSEGCLAMGSREPDSTMTFWRLIKWRVARPPCPTHTVPTTFSAYAAVSVFGPFQPSWPSIGRIPSKRSGTGSAGVFRIAARVRRGTGREHLYNKWLIIHQAIFFMASIVFGKMAVQHIPVVRYYRGLFF
jgi:hypothetical protein